MFLQPLIDMFPVSIPIVPNELLHFLELKSLQKKAKYFIQVFGVN
jgi:hypothetical protein